MVVDPSGAAVPKAEVSLRNAITGYTQNTFSGPDGSFRLTNLPPNPYRLEVNASGFASHSQTVDVKNAIPIAVKAALALAGSNTTVTVEAVSQALETDPSAHVDIDRSQLLKLPVFDPGAGLSQILIE